MCRLSALIIRHRVADGMLTLAGPATYIHEGKGTFGHDNSLKVGDAEALRKIMLARVPLSTSQAG